MVLPVSECSFAQTDTKLDMARFLSGPKLLPQCIEEKTSGDVGQATDYPIGFTYEQWFEFYFRVKDWQVEIQWSASGSCTASTASASASAGGPGTGDSATDFDDESDFACVYNQSFANLTNDTDFDDDSTPEGFASVGVGSSFPNPTVGINNVSCYKVGSLYYPKMFFNFSIGGTASGGSGEGFPFYEELITSIPNYAPGDPNYSPYVMTLEVGGITAPKEGTKGMFDSSEGEGTAVVNTSITLIKFTPKSYWSYDGIWNPSTGAQILNPFNP